MSVIFPPAILGPEMAAADDAGKNNSATLGKLRHCKDKWIQGVFLKETVILLCISLQKTVLWGNGVFA